MFKTQFVLVLVLSIFSITAQANDEPTFMDDMELSQVEGAFITNYNAGVSFLSSELNYLNTWMSRYLPAINHTNSKTIRDIGVRVNAAHRDQTVIYQGYTFFQRELRNTYEAKYTQIKLALESKRLNILTANSLVNSLNQRYQAANAHLSRNFPRN